MKVIKKGDPEETEWYVGNEAACRKCFSVVKFDKNSDATPQDDYRNGTYYEWKCPVCKATNTFQGK
jgi:hypothetical protein